MIKFKDVHKTYKNTGVNALKGVTFLIDDGEFVFIIGKSGSGKSTIMKCINCEEKPSEGAVYIDGFDISNMPRALVPTLRRQIGMIFQDFRLIESKTVYENIAFAGEIIGINKSELRQKVQVCLNIVGLKEKVDAYPQQLSGGEQQRVAIARAMISNPKVIVADEPTGNLDPDTSENIMGLLLDINRAGTTVIVCTHDANLVNKMKKRVIEIEGGLVVRDKEDAAYLEETTDPYAELPIGDLAFGDDADYRTDFDEDTYSAVNEQTDFYFGETPKSAMVTPKAPVSTAPVPAAAVVPEEIPVPVETNVDELPVEAVPVPVEEIPVESLTVTETPVEELPVEALPVESLPVEEVVPEEIPVEQAPAPIKEIPVPSFADAMDEPRVEDFSREAAPVIEELPVTDLLFEGAAKPAEDSSVLEEDDDEDDDSWISKIRMDDIDLDIQEDDE